MELQFSFEEKTLTACSYFLPGFLELLEKALARLDMIYFTIPCFIDHIHEAGHFDPKKFKAKRLWFLRATIICKKKRTMIRQGRGERM
jgi:hypothetical protein